VNSGGEFETFSLDEVRQLTGAPSQDWLSRRISSGELSAVLAGRSWRMTRSDMCRVVNYMRAAAKRHLAERAAASPDAGPPTLPSNAAGLSARSAARMRRRASEISRDR